MYWVVKYEYVSTKTMSPNFVGYILSNWTVFQLGRVISERQSMVCAPVRRDNLRASASGLSTAQAHKSCSMISIVDLARYGIYHAKDLGIWDTRKSVQDILEVIVRGKSDVYWMTFTQKFQLNEPI